jgi:hypothetical protein
MYIVISFITIFISQFYCQPSPDFEQSSSSFLSPPLMFSTSQKWFKSSCTCPMESSCYRPMGYRYILKFNKTFCKRYLQPHICIQSATESIEFESLCKCGEKWLHNKDISSTQNRKTTIFSTTQISPQQNNSANIWWIAICSVIFGGVTFGTAGIILVYKH